MVETAFSVSPAMPLASAIRSCESRDRRRTQRPIRMIGTSTAGTSTRIRPISRKLVKARQHQRADELNRRAQNDGQADPGNRLNQRGIGGQARQHFARLRDLEKSRIHANHVPVNAVAQVGDHPLAQPVHEVRAGRREDAEQQGHCQEVDEIAIDRRRIGGRKAEVDDIADRNRDREKRARRDEQGDQCQQPACPCKAR